MSEYGVPSMRKIRRYVVVARATPAIIESYVRLVRAEATLAKENLKPLLIASAVAAVCAIVALSVLACGAVIGLHDRGIGLIVSIAVPVVITSVIGGIAGWSAYRWLGPSTFSESRKRLSWIVEALYD
ncbi:hypothetical protein ELE36_07160 [Pseudolysobacter antarcticus]|uniref:Uncharacterized protein n=1 Tax=Pseudolysobacter antarcticus TaxID=2511995 RepID=A0A411HID8_9GAMM|nr:phage holin family protein [Pseudolysobacter antarcticus]QBB70160.1 hypothetical protein ELE36_07160 [Pseudolysobacter antarcticus]